MIKYTSIILAKSRVKVVSLEQEILVVAFETGNVGFQEGPVTEMHEKKGKVV